ncbi:M23 family metallopeptidase [Thauera sinica]|uniref:M23 family metallopeptidase n=1 Tax=Thauera sinica TaxID=2665146 RepID=A0ABW1ALH1_9RHOO|nr:peptidoglycan DD-metalloendopeptidase family protein [Thauera sp. K11]ATE60767.1 peptidase M23 [Thauera sp. K11]
MQTRKTRILAELPAQLLSHPRAWAVAAVAGISLSGVVAAIAVPQQGPSQIVTRSVVERLPPPVAAAPAPNDLPFVSELRVQSGDTAQALFRRLRIDDPEALAFLTESGEGRQALRQLRAGRSVTAVVHGNGQLQSFALPAGQEGERVVVERGGDGRLKLRADREAATATLVEMRSGVIRSSLFAATDAADLPDEVANKLVELFGTEIDFHADLRKGDRFNVIYEAIYDRGTAVRTGRVLAAEFINQGKSHVVVLHQRADKEQYYTADGRSLGQAFLRSPLEFSRVTSSFGGRIHPILNRARDHKGVDFGAPVGTPVKATSDGVVEYAGWQRGYGNLIVLQHRGRIATAYAHLNGFARNLKQGQAVSQGDLIGYVGTTGMSTGPHLHYEVRINGEAHDPMTVALPLANALESRELQAFRRDTAPLLHRFALLNRSTQVARAE